MRFVHRSLENQEIYWVNTTSEKSQSINVTFKVSGLKPELWNPVSGEISEISYTIENGKTEVKLNLDPEDAIFVVFREKTKTSSFELPQIVEKELLSISGDWQVSFQPERGAPESATFNELTPWNENETSGIKYFSGTAQYSKTIEISDEWLSENSEIWLDLGEVKNLAEVTLNGTPLGVVWKKPFKIKLNKAIKAGENQLTVNVTNLWVNRLIGDAQPDAGEKFTYTTMPFYQANSPRKPSGLLGPVNLIKVKN